eukprot:29017-Pelagococcus_subviridis.AAC.3
MGPSHRTTYRQLAEPQPGTRDAAEERRQEGQGGEGAGVRVQGGGLRAVRVPRARLDSNAARSGRGRPRGQVPRPEAAGRERRDVGAVRRDEARGAHRGPEDDGGVHEAVRGDARAARGEPVRARDSRRAREEGGGGGGEAREGGGRAEGVGGARGEEEQEETEAEAAARGGGGGVIVATGREGRSERRNRVYDVVRRLLDSKTGPPARHNPASSGSPSAKFMFCTAAPDAPFPKLSNLAISQTVCASSDAYARSSNALVSFNASGLRAEGGSTRSDRGVGGEKRREEKSLRIGVHLADAVVWEPVRRLERASKTRRAPGRPSRSAASPSRTATRRTAPPDTPGSPPRSCPPR